MTTMQDYINHKFEKANDALKAGEILYENGLPVEAVSKIYYAVFNAALALLAQSNLAPKTHTGVKSLFNKEYVLSGKMDKKTGSILGELLNKRMEADYEDFTLIDNDELPELFKKAKKFIYTAKQQTNLQ